MCPDCPQQPEDGKGYCAVGAQNEEKGATENVAGDGTEFVEKVDCCGKARGHFYGLREGSTQAATIVHQGPGDVKEGEHHR